MLPGEERPATLRLEDGLIVEVGSGTADLDFGDHAILPGLVDSHVHVNEPGRTDWEGYASATAAAVAGGTTTIVDMPLNSIPPTVDVAALRAKRAATDGKLSADVAFWGGVVPGSLHHAAELVEEGVCGFKVFMAESGVPEFPPIPAGGLDTVVAELSRLEVPLLVHAEDPSEFRDPEGDRRRYATYLSSRPGLAEAAAIRQVARSVATSGGSAHVLHVAGAEAVDALRAGPADGSVTSETCPHYLTFVAEQIPDGATTFKCAPPIRSREDREALWESLREGTVGMVVSDHSPSPPALKDVVGGDFIGAWGGIASVELRLQATWTGAQLRGFDLPDIVSWLASAPAELAGLGRTKGGIRVGADADLVVFDPDGATHVAGSRLRQRHPHTPYDGMRLRGRLAATFLGGTQVEGRGAVAGRHGKLLRRGV